MDQAKFVLDFDIKAVEPQADGSLLLRGYASTWDVDRDREAVQPAAMKAALTGYLSNPILLWQHHADRVIGRITKAAVDAVGLLVEAVMPPPPDGSEAWHIKAFHDVRNGLYRAFSIGGMFGKAKGSGSITSLDLMEVSVVAVPANPTALFEVVQKAFELDVDEKAAMTAAERNNLDDSDFAYVDSDGKGHFPIHDEAHARSAVSMFSTHHFPDAATKAKAARKILAAAKKFGIEVQDDSAVAQAAAGKAISITDLKAVMAQLDADFDAILAQR